MAVFFTPEWAEEVREAVDRGPGEELRAAKLPAYWAWIDGARASYSSSWALGVRDLAGGGPVYLRLGWKDGACAEAAIVGPDDPLDATYVLVADFATWRDLLAGEDPGRIVMYRRLRLQEGDVLRFFRGIYFFIESVAAIGRVAARLP
ncbi:MAG: hypothetical protein JWR24_1819 [Actinoallomurus sp.]|nr:hypothetical protein [Actinoallomurus sp.]